MPPRSQQGKCKLAKQGKRERNRERERESVCERESMYVCRSKRGEEMKRYTPFDAFAVAVKKMDEVRNLKHVARDLAPHHKSPD